MLPPSLAPWVISRPESILSATDAQIDAIEGTHTMLSWEVVHEPVHKFIIQRDLKHHLAELAPDVQDEISHAVDTIWGLDTESFKMVNLDATIRSIVTRASNRAFVGSPLCEKRTLHHRVKEINTDVVGRDPVFTENTLSYIDSIPLNALFLKLFPGPLRAFITQFSSLGTRLFQSRCTRLLKPFFENRISAWHQDPTTMLNNFADWLVNDAFKLDNPSDRTPDRLSRRLMAVNFAAVHTTTMTAANMMLDIASGSEGRSCLAAISTECQQLSVKYGSQWSPARLTEMIVTDSALRESMRLSGFAGKGFSRKVMPPNGLSLPNGVHVPHGKTVCISAYSLHHDESIYAKPYQFIYNRFLQPLADGEESPLQLSKSATTTEVNHAPWGHGKHACPGRFFAVALIKMILAYIVEKYELEIWDERPANFWLVETPLPPRNVLIGIRRR